MIVPAGEAASGDPDAPGAADGPAHAAATRAAARGPASFTPLLNRERAPPSHRPDGPATSTTGRELRFASVGVVRLCDASGPRPLPFRRVGERPNSALGCVDSCRQEAEGGH